jgi:hypothetical protein
MRKSVLIAAAFALVLGRAAWSANIPAPAAPAVKAPVAPAGAAAPSDKAPAPAAETTVKVNEREDKDRLALKDGTEVTGTVVAMGPLGAVVIVGEAEQFFKIDLLKLDDSGRPIVAYGIKKEMPARFKVVDSKEGQLIIQGRSETPNASDGAAPGTPGGLLEDIAKKLEKAPADANAAANPAGEKPKFYASGTPAAKPGDKKKDAAKKDRPAPAPFFASGSEPVTPDDKNKKQPQDAVPAAGQNPSIPPSIANDPRYQELIKQWGSMLPNSTNTRRAITTPAQIPSPAK